MLRVITYTSLSKKTNNVLVLVRKDLRNLINSIISNNRVILIHVIKIGNPIVIISSKVRNLNRNNVIIKVGNRKIATFNDNNVVHRKRKIAIKILIPKVTNKVLVLNTTLL